VEIFAKAVMSAGEYDPDLLAAIGQITQPLCEAIERHEQRRVLAVQALDLKLPQATLVWATRFAEKIARIDHPLARELAPTLRHQIEDRLCVWDWLCAAWFPAPANGGVRGHAVAWFSYMLERHEDRRYQQWVLKGAGRAAPNTLKRIVARAQIGFPLNGAIAGAGPMRCGFERKRIATLVRRWIAFDRARHAAHQLTAGFVGFEFGLRMLEQQPLEPSELLTQLEALVQSTLAEMGERRLNG
jgi:hypothetical protein